MKSLLEKVLAFIDARDWRQFHTPRSLAVSLSLEAAEVLEIFQWQDDLSDTALSDADRQRLKEELADVLIYLLLLGNRTHIDLAQAVEEKLVINEAKYPVEKSKGRATKYTDLV